MAWLLKFFRLKTAEKLALAEALATLMYFRALVHFMPNGWVSRRVTSFRNQDVSIPASEVAQVLLPFHRIASVWPDAASCVPSALAVRSYLRRRGIETHCRIGSCFSPAKLKAHCWLEVGGQPVWGIDGNYDSLEIP